MTFIDSKGQSTHSTKKAKLYTKWNVHKSTIMLIIDEIIIIMSIKNVAALVCTWSGTLLKKRVVSAFENWTQWSTETLFCCMTKCIFWAKFYLSFNYWSWRHLKRLRRDSEEIPKRLQRDSEAFPKRLRRDSEETPKRLQRDSENEP